MFKNRAFQVKMVKDKDEIIDYDEEDVWFEERVELIEGLFTRTILKIGIVIVAYVAADTARQVILKQLDE